MSAEPTAPPVEMAAYVLVVEVLEDAIARGASCLVVDGTNDESRITLTLDDDGSPRTSAMLAAADRIAAAGGTLEIERGRVRAELPLA
jgi:hypothetical protein